MTGLFLDANIFMYAAGKPHLYKESCVRILSDVENGNLTAVINTEILQELLYRYSRIGVAQKGIQLCRKVMELSLTVLPVTQSDIHFAIDLFDKYHTVGVKVRDAVHAASIRQNGITDIPSADKDFDHFDFIRRIDPIDYV